MKYVLALLLAVSFAGAAGAEEPAPAAVWDGSACFERSQGRTVRLDFFEILSGQQDFPKFTALLHRRDPALRAVYATVEDLQCELALAMKGALGANGKELTADNGEYLIGALFISARPGDGTNQFFDGLKVLPNSSARVVYWEIPLIKLARRIDDKLTNVVRVAPGFGDVSIKSGGVVYDAEAILTATENYYAYWRRPDLGTFGYVHPAFMTFRDDSGRPYVAMIGADRLFRVAPVDRQRSLRAYERAYKRLKADGAGLDASDRAAVEAAKAVPGLALMVLATERSWEFEPLSVVNFLGVDGNFERLRDFHAFSRTLSEGLGQ